MERKERVWTKQFILPLVITIGVSLACNLLLSTISIYAKQLTNVDTYAGMMTASFTLSALFIRLVAGKMLDKIGRRKVLVIGTVITTLSTIVFLFTDSINVIILLRAIQGFGFGISSTAIATIVTDVTPETRMLEGIGYSGVGITITTAIGPSLALALVGKDYGNFKLLFITTAVVSIITILLSFKLSYKENIKVDIINQIVNKVGINVVVSSGVAIFAFSIFGMSMVQTYSMLIIIGFICGVMIGSLLPIVNVMILDSVSKSKRGMANAIYYALLDGGYGIGSIIWGNVIVACGYRSIYAYSGVALIVAFGLFTISIIMIKRKDSITA